VDRDSCVLRSVADKNNLNIRNYLQLICNEMRAYRGRGCESTRISALRVRGAERLALRSGRFILDESGISIHWTRDLVGLRALMSTVVTSRKILAPACPFILQTVFRHT
jgi:hypothetical protein